MNMQLVPSLRRRKGRIRRRRGVNRRRGVRMTMTMRMRGRGIVGGGGVRRCVEGGRPGVGGATVVVE
jgi:hypothetical protein